ncbi:MAG TPA: hypothetical protein PKW21_01140 [Rhabdaerophilum sp.]|nr:hypothetical protein [Rhabdaerophilum sp.]
MAKLNTLIVDFSRQEIPRLDEAYHWPRPEELPICNFIPQFESDASACLRLRHALHKQWVTSASERRQLERWYVAEWGRIRANRPETLALYSEMTNQCLIERGMQGIASWSKILAIRNPEKYQIYDARVAASLNALQIIGTGTCAEHFPNVPSRNKVIVEFQRKLAPILRHSQTEATRNPYRRYLAIIAYPATECANHSAERVEMALFANAEHLVREPPPVCRRLQLPSRMEP